MNEELIHILYGKARSFMKNRQKRVKFALHHRLYRSSRLDTDLKLLARDSYQVAGPLESHVWGERYDLDKPKSHVTLLEENFWDFVHSPGWRSFTSLRITEGALLDSLLFVYHTLVREGALLTYTTDVYEHNCSTKLNNKGRNGDREDETIKVTFTYYGTSPQKLSETITQDGLDISADEISHRNSRDLLQRADQQGMPDDSRPTTISAWMPPDAALNVARDVVSRDIHEDHKVATKHVGFVDCDAFPVQHQHHLEDDEFACPPTPINPPNSPSQIIPTERSASTRTRNDFTDGKNNRDIWVRPYTTPANNEMPLILRERYLRLGGGGSGGTEGAISVIGHGLNEGMSTFGYPKTPVLGTKGGPRSVRKAFRSKRRHQSQLPKVPTYSLPISRQQTCTSSTTALQMRLIEKNRLHESDKPKLHILAPSPKLEFINVINPLSPVFPSPTNKQSTPSPQNSRPFDTDKLRINYSLEEVRPELVRSPVAVSRRSRDSRPSEYGAGGKDYLMQKYIGESSTRCQSPNAIYRPGYPDGVRKSAHLLSTGHKQSTQPTETVDLVIGNSGKNATTSQSPITDEPLSPKKAVQYQFFKQRTPGNFRMRCLKACDEFVIRKEQITTSRLYTTVTSVTVNRVPTGGFGQWKFIDC